MTELHCGEGLWMEKSGDLFMYVVTFDFYLLFIYKQSIKKWDISFISYVKKHDYIVFSWEKMNYGSLVFVAWLGSRCRLLQIVWLILDACR